MGVYVASVRGGLFMATNMLRVCDGVVGVFQLEVRRQGGGFSGGHIRDLIDVLQVRR
jgi:hypothetical protein